MSYYNYKNNDGSEYLIRYDNINYEYEMNDYDKKYKNLLEYEINDVLEIDIDTGDNYCMYKAFDESSKMICPFNYVISSLKFDIKMIGCNKKQIYYSSVKNIIFLNIQKHINFLSNKITNLGMTIQLNINNLSKSIKTLYIGISNKKINNLPYTIKKFGVSNYNTKILKLPNTINHLILDPIYDFDNLQIFIFGDNFQIYNLENLPKSIKTLEISMANKNKLNLDFIPEGIEIIKMPPNNDIKINDLPSSIKEIWIYNNQGLNYINKIYHHKVKIYKNY